MDQIPLKCSLFLYPQGPLDPLVQQDLLVALVLPDLQGLKELQDLQAQPVPLGQMVLMVVMGRPPGLVHQLHLQDQ